jgi:hypothetical protein
MTKLYIILSYFEDIDDLIKSFHMLRKCKNNFCVLKNVLCFELFVNVFILSE